jgi:NAD(P)-dependent dehydrogenase (short-subunit alcohol dehydrogenase family)
MPRSSETAIITGAAQGVGLAVAKLLVARRLKVVVSDVNARAGETAVADINKEHGDGAAIFVACDLSKTEDIEKLIATTVERFGDFSILINNAGFLRAPFLAITADDIKNTIAINLTAVIYSTQQAIKFWDEHPDINGQVVNVTS